MRSFKEIFERKHKISKKELRRDGAPPDSVMFHEVICYLFRLCWQFEAKTPESAKREIFRFPFLRNAAAGRTVTCVSRTTRSASAYPKIPFFIPVPPLNATSAGNSLAPAQQNTRRATPQATSDRGRGRGETKREAAGTGGEGLFRSVTREDHSRGCDSPVPLRPWELLRALPPNFAKNNPQ